MISSPYNTTKFSGFAAYRVAKVEIILPILSLCYYVCLVRELFDGILAMFSTSDKLFEDDNKAT